MHLISCALTQPQIRNRSKTETRRLGWKNAKKGDLLCFVDKCMGFKPGQKPHRIAVVVVTSVRRERLIDIRQKDVDREGFPGMPRERFVEMFRDNMKCSPFDQVTVIRFQYIPGGRC